MPCGIVASFAPRRSAAETAGGRPHITCRVPRTACGGSKGLMDAQFDLVVIGGGSGGLAAAQRAAEYGARVVLIESGALGGTCVNVGCVPKKIMWNAAEVGAALHAAAGYGFEPGAAQHDWARAEARARRLHPPLERHLRGATSPSATSSCCGGVRSCSTRRTVSVAGRTLRAAHIIVATGGRPVTPAIAGADLGITSDGFFALSARPARVAVVGGSYIAIELAGIFAQLGSADHAGVAGHEDPARLRLDAGRGHARDDARCGCQHRHRRSAGRARARRRRCAGA